MEMTKEEIIQRWKDIIDDYFGLKEQVQKDIISLDIPSIINNMKIEESKVSGTIRGSDNYLFSVNFLVSKYDYEDVYLNQIFPQVHEELSEYYEKRGEITYSELYKNNPDLALLKKKFEEECKDKAWDAYRNKYNRSEHFDLVFKNHLNSSCYGLCPFYYAIRYKHGLKILKDYIEAKYGVDKFEDVFKLVQNNPEDFAECTFDKKTLRWI